MQKNYSKDVDTYISRFPKNTQHILKVLRETIHTSAPDAEETLKYGIPTLVLCGNLVHFGGYKKHIGFYPAPSGISTFKDELSVYKTAKGSVQFPIDKPLPIELISKIIKHRVKENLGI